MREEKQSEIIHDALNYLDDELIDDVEKLRGYIDKEELEHSSSAENHVIFMEKVPNKQRYWRKWTTLAASVCVLILGGWMVSSGLVPEVDTAEKEEMELENSNKDETFVNKESVTDEANQGELTPDEAEDFDNIRDNEEAAQVTSEFMKTGVTIPEMKVNLKKAGEGEVQADMLGFFIYQGRCYIQYEFQDEYVEEGADFVGEPVGKVTGLINEWTPEDGYVDGAGTYTGEIYEVKGVSSDFMLCMVWENGSVETFINHNGITLYKGSDLVDDWLDLRGNVEAISLETSMGGQIAYRNLPLTEEEMDVFKRFLDAFAEGDFVYVEEKLNHPFGGDQDTPDMMDFYFEKEDGLRLRFRTLGDGYVSFPWIDACVQIDQELYDEVVEVLTENTR